ncbi:nucleotidyltransferase family protein [Motilimonas cestriensis]|uniref:Nucleotidyltransferase family protein n=1 Tax=Motilimonas cestriensis TaxID=2742685 RepID=A0ABS8W8V7_9GAMM|nr:nucleotidyltransferase family protein [Motilimonas cestriensis]MCE2594183.1 nucleotidyltransferase family protein [Motilimonas cestriensis]
MDRYQDPLMCLLRAPDLAQNFSPEQWNLALGQAELAQLMGVLASQYLPASSWLPQVVQQRLAWANRLVEHQQRAVNMALQQLFDALGMFSPMLLKGAAYQVAATPNSAGRMMSDIDILIPQQHLQKAEQSLWLHGWDNRGKTPYDEKYYRAWMHELPPFVHQKTGIILDLHHHWLPSSCRWQFDINEVCKKASYCTESSFLIPEIKDLCIHSAIHLVTSGEGDKGWRDLRDLYLLSQLTEREPLLARAEQFGLVKPVAKVLVLAEQLFGEQPIAPTASWALKAMLPAHSSYQSWSVSAAKMSFYCQAHLSRMPLPLLLPHLMRKAAARYAKA